MSIVTSADNVRIAYDKVGKGPLLIIVNGALSFRKSKGVKELVDELGKDFTVLSYDRRGRGESGDSQTYDVEKEISDIEALVNENGGAAVVFGVSSGAALAFYAAEKLGPEKITRIALYEPPFGFADVTGREKYDEERKKINEKVRANKPGEAIEIFFQSLGSKPEQIEGMKRSPDWKDMESVGHTLVYDFEILGDGTIPLDHAKKIKVPALVMDGSESFEFMHKTAGTLAENIPGAERKTLNGQTHEISPQLVGPVLKEFFGAEVFAAQ